MTKGPNLRLSSMLTLNPSLNPQEVWSYSEA
jgi:hypothetical protein